MKKALFNWMAGAFILMASFSFNAAAQGRVSLQVFYDELQPYGNWINHTNYGYVWVPNVDRDFTPYATNGYWINTEYGNTWVSDYSWGWAPFHYGRWFYDDYYGWAWVPDTEWGPAWVAWRSGGGYYGWAPLMPGLSINVSFNYYNNIPYRYWSFVPYRYITYRTVHHHCVPRTQVVNIINHTTIVTHNHYDNRRRSTYFTGPSRHEIERDGRERVTVYNISDRSRPGRSDFDRGSVSFYKPDVENDHHGRTRPAPSRVMNDDHTRDRNRTWAESRTERPAEFRNTHDDDRKNSDRNDRLNGNGNKTDHQRFSERHDQPRTFNAPDRSQPKGQNNDHAFDRSHQRENSARQFNRPEEKSQVNRESSQRRTDDKPQQHAVERQRESRQSSSHEQQVRRSSSDHHSNSSSSHSGSRSSTSRKRD